MKSEKADTAVSSKIRLRLEWDTSSILMLPEQIEIATSGLSFALIVELFDILLDELAQLLHALSLPEAKHCVHHLESDEERC